MLHKINSEIDTRSHSVVITTGKMITMFRRGDDLAAAHQIAVLHSVIEGLKAERESTYICSHCEQTYHSEDAECPWCIIERLRAELQAAGDRFHEMNTPTGREIELKEQLGICRAVLREIVYDSEAMRRELGDELYARAKQAGGGE